MELRWYQREAVDAAWRYLCTQAGNPVIVLPTGAGKSLCIADICRSAVSRYQGKVIILAHRKELLQQNAEKLAAIASDLDVGINSAGLKRRQYDHDVIFAGIQSVYKDAEAFGQRNLVLIDEVHLVPANDEGMYRKFLSDLRRCNPTLRMIGLTATPYRTDSGALCREDALFQKICYDAPIQRLIADGFLCPVTNQSSATEFDTQRLAVVRGEFSSGDMQLLFGETGKVKIAVSEIVAKAADRKSVLLFCSGVQHAELVAEELAKQTGEQVGIVTGDTFPMIRANYLEAFRTQRLRWLVNVDVLTTGFDAPCVDCIAILRATMSPGLFAQICGRGLRLHASKQNCLLLDFGENIKRHGPIDAIDFGKQSSRGDGTGDGPTKTCPNCAEVIAAGRRVCECGFRFPEPKMARHEETADSSSEVLAVPERWAVVGINMARHIKKKDDGKPNTLRIDYIVVPWDTPGGNLAEQTICEWVCVEHEGFARQKAKAWWQQRSMAPLPDDIDAAIELWRRGALASTVSITTKREGRWHRIIDATLDEIPTDWADALEFAEEDVPF